MNSRQRRGVILLVLSVLCALAAFAGVLAVINNVESKVGPETTAYELKDDVPAYRTLEQRPVRRRSPCRKRWLPETAVTDLRRHSRARSPSTRCKKGSLLQSDMIVRAARTASRGSRRSPS